MKWAELKAALENAGVTDDTEVFYIDVSEDNVNSLRITVTNGGFSAYN